MESVAADLLCISFYAFGGETIKCIDQSTKTNGALCFDESKK